ncbi:binding--dependent transport system inner membrane component family protein [Paraburkholderia xenovorans LB400]|uniref:ABC spermidine/putrescine transporter, inner membrane subunit n=1 Tax=Paraburkholderia xenovorans (strain LB400) TaxID=266265 RepID=Q13R39_PARXL|nr:ABC transporter permease [Paraburkholderia xenovorans]ABE33450.1 ABC spermidine/putrescine transporter, inner membrane subunit [Paraburkholderia xenovorans LB400]AIP37938.1 binding--dependent transport system inner membrane component family protein [Paraburkholderia xenovorans LB400]
MMNTAAHVGKDLVQPEPKRRDRRAALRVLGSVGGWCGYLFLLLPSLVIVPISFGGGSELTFPPRTFSFSLFQQFFADPAWWGACMTSVMVALLASAIAIAVGVPGAYALARGHFPGKRVLETLAITPMLVPVVVLGLGIYKQFSALALVNTIGGLALAHAVLVVPFVIIAVGSGLRHADASLEAVALVMGASRTRIFFQVVLPQIRASVAVSVLFAFLLSFDEVVVAYFISGPQTTTLPVKMYSAIRWEVSPVLAAVSTLLTLISLLVCLGIMTLQRRDSDTE